jgi:hypothetical protein
VDVLPTAAERALPTKEYAIAMSDAYRYLSTEDAIRVARQGALDALRRLRALQHAVSLSEPETWSWYTEASRWLVEMPLLCRSSWPAAMQTAKIAGRLPTAARRVEESIPVISLACQNSLPYVTGLVRALENALQEAPPDNPTLFYLQDWPRMLAIDPMDRWRVTRSDRLTPTLQYLRADPMFRCYREGMLRACSRLLAPFPEWKYYLSPARLRRAASPGWRGEPLLEIDELRRVLAGLNVDRLQAELDFAAAQPKARMSIDEANEKASALAKQLGKVFFGLSEREQARKIGCSWQTWTKTPLYATAQKKKTRAEQSKRKGNLRGPAVVSFSDKIEAVAGKEDEELQRLIEEQQADSEPSPLAPDPIDRPRRLRHRKRL